MASRLSVPHTCPVATTSLFGWIAMLKYFSININNHATSRKEKKRAERERERERETDLLVQIRNLLTADADIRIREEKDFLDFC